MRTGSKNITAELVQNEWSDAARQAAAEARKRGHTHGVFLKGGSIGTSSKTTEHGSLSSTHASEAEAKEKAGRMNKILSPGEKKGYGMRYHVKPLP